MVVVPFLLAAGFGFGIWICARALNPRPEPVPAILARLDSPAHALASSSPLTGSTLIDRVAADAREFLDRFGFRSPKAADLDIAGRTAERHAFDKLVGALLGLVVPTLLAVVLAFAGVGFPMGLTVLFAVGAAVAGFVLPDLTLREGAQRHRREFRHALSAYLDLVNILLAGGAGIETALFAAADTGDGATFQRLRIALDRARRTGRSPWDSFADLGRTVGVAELSELAASVSLAGSHGARIRSSLAAKADALRGHQLAETEAAAESATERMTIPLAVLLFGFLVLIAYPAIEQITTATGA